MNGHKVERSLSICKEFGIKRSDNIASDLFHEPIYLQQIDEKTILFLEKKDKNTLFAFDLELGRRWLWLESEEPIVCFKHHEGNTLIIYHHGLLLFQRNDQLHQLRMPGCCENVFGDFDEDAIYILHEQNQQLLLFEEMKLSKKVCLKHLFLKEISSFRVCEKELIISDCEAHIVYRLSIDGTVIQSFGDYGHPGMDKKLAYPEDAMLVDDQLIIADAMNHRLIKIDRTGEIVWIYGQRNLKRVFYSNLLYWPKSILLTKQQTILVADSRNHRVIELNYQQQKESLKIWGGNGIEKRALNFPRSIQLQQGTSSLLISDTANNRILSADLRSNEYELINTSGGQQAPSLFWPRWSWKKDGRLVIADARHSRILSYEQNQQTYKEILLPASADPHQCCVVPGGIFIVDSMSSAIFYYDNQSGRLTEVFSSLELNDPHYIDKYDGWICIADSGNHRIIVMNETRSIFKEIEEIDGIKLTYPRFCQVINNHQLICSTGTNGFLFVLQLPSLQVELLIKTEDPDLETAVNKTRSIILTNHQLLISDNYFSRIIWTELEKGE